MGSLPEAVILNFSAWGVGGSLRDLRTPVLDSETYTVNDPTLSPLLHEEDGVHGLGAAWQVKARQAKVKK